ncbi:MAG: DUF6231 family protein [Abyssibacter sp.]|uniref:DUF6231 family protein n=1 Tax=Abyssibacter sp. TaxID=2320200 RepID=UPI00321B6B88
MSAEAAHILTHLITPLTCSEQPFHARWLGDIHDPLPQRLATSLQALIWTESEALTRWSLAVFDARTSRPAPQDVAWWRDVGARQVFVLGEASLRFDPMLASLGLRPVARGQTQAVWAFDIADYKPRPDWLNPRFWANPERWDQARW